MKVLWSVLNPHVQILFILSVSGCSQQRSQGAYPNRETIPRCLFCLGGAFGNTRSHFARMKTLALRDLEGNLDNVSNHLCAFHYWQIKAQRKFYSSCSSVKTFFWRQTEKETEKIWIDLDKRLNVMTQRDVRANSKHSSRDHESWQSEWRYVDHWKQMRWSGIDHIKTCIRGSISLWLNESTCWECRWEEEASNLSIV
jgi:hypothetical protein